MTFKVGDLVQFNPEYFEGNEEDLFFEYGAGRITEPEKSVIDHFRLRSFRHRRHHRPPLRSRLCSPSHYVIVQWEGLEEECWEYVGYLMLCTIEDHKPDPLRDIYNDLHKMLS